MVLDRTADVEHGGERIVFVFHSGAHERGICRINGNDSVVDRVVIINTGSRDVRVDHQATKTRPERQPRVGQACIEASVKAIRRCR